MEIMSKEMKKYILSFDALATVAYERGVVTLIGDEMWRVQQIASKASSKIGDAGLNIFEYGCTRRNFKNYYRYRRCRR